MYPQKVTLYQTGDTVEGASFNNFLDAIDGSYCTSGGGDNPTYDGIYPDTASGGYKGAAVCSYIHDPTVSTSTRLLISTWGTKHANAMST